MWKYTPTKNCCHIAYAGGQSLVVACGKRDHLLFFIIDKRKNNMNPNFQNIYVLLGFWKSENKLVSHEKIDKYVCHEFWFEVNYIAGNHS